MFPGFRLRNVLWPGSGLTMPVLGTLYRQFVSQNTLACASVRERRLSSRRAALVRPWTIFPTPMEVEGVAPPEAQPGILGRNASPDQRGGAMKRLLVALLVAVALVYAATASAAGWSTSVPLANQVASSPTLGGGYPVPAGATAPAPGTCRLGDYNSNLSESWLAVHAASQHIVGVSKFFFENFSTFYNFHLGSYTIPSGVPAQNTPIPGSDCVSTGSQEMPPSWTNNTDPNVDFDSRGRAYQATLPFNAFWVNLHPNGAIGV